ncbi:MAG: hypothetical protein WAW85_07935 [Gordonia sp. (in: high G+C Gram-positive bacteria)]|uniref:hypothetical protein n=1 Tax=Gordonia sp. (in: high G+C Gram-positive bacteria) TaxID=84139 RepID=UPI003BB6E32A
MSFKEFWWTSALSALDTRDSQSHVLTRTVRSGLVTGVPPEEVTTFNLVRRLTNRRSAAGGTAVALHSRQLEGGNKSVGRVGSGIDLEIAVQVDPHTWYDLVLQAKRFNPETGTYDHWSSSQNTQMTRWATAHHRKTPGMLLYNTMTPPFPANGQHSDLFLACCTQPKRRHGWRWPGKSPANEFTLPDERSPLAVSIVHDPSLLSLDKPSPDEIAAGAYPWECLFCPGVGPLLGMEQDQMPGWAMELLTLVEGADQDPRALDALDEDAEDRAAMSLVLALGPDEAV